MKNFKPNISWHEKILNLSDWFYCKSCYYKDVESLDTLSWSYIRAWTKFMWLCFKDNFKPAK